MNASTASPDDLSIGWYASPEFLALDRDHRQRLIDRAADAGIDHVFVGDHISFHNGFGMDGLINAATLAAMSSSLSVIVGVYLLAMRHPVPVARQIASLAASAPGRLVLGVGLGGEDPHEMEICGIDPKKRGRATNDALAAMDLLLSGEAASYDCEFFRFEDALILPAPTPAVPVMIGGRSTAAVRRTARFGDGWLGIWCSPQRFGAVAGEVEGLAEEIGRSGMHFRHGLQAWVGFGEKTAARAKLEHTMRTMYQLPFEPFEKYSPYGEPAEVAAFLAPYAEQGARVFNLACCGESFEHEIDSVAEIATTLRTTSSAQAGES